MTSTANPTRCTIAGLPDHQHAEVDATITAIDLKHEGTTRPWAVLTLTDDTGHIETRVYPAAYSLWCDHIQLGNRVTAAGEVANDPAGVFMAAHTIHAAVNR